MTHLLSIGKMRRLGPFNFANSVQIGLGGAKNLTKIASLKHYPLVLVNVKYKDEEKDKLAS